MQGYLRWGEGTSTRLPQLSIWGRNWCNRNHVSKTSVQESAAHYWTVYAGQIHWVCPFNIWSCQTRPKLSEIRLPHIPQDRLIIHDQPMKKTRIPPCILNLALTKSQFIENSHAMLSNLFMHTSTTETLSSRFIMSLCAKQKPTLIPKSSPPYSHLRVPSAILPFSGGTARVQTLPVVEAELSPDDDDDGECICLFRNTKNRTKKNQRNEEGSQ